ncbi:molybdate ABC transporter substrate-binding protein [Tepidibacillus marianensis]|uniref:molybdate ABC transporter substrate-binding protein n=1 Tax=Tepidibacillus marianensis TaxID=3131995 RepID=UPI0030CF2AB4
MLTKKIIPYFILISILTILTGCNASPSPSTSNVELTVSIAASLTDAMNEAKINFEKDHPNIKINYNLGGSGTLEQQIEQGAPVDLFISAAPDKMDLLEKKDLLLPNSRKNLLSNELVLITQSNLNGNSDSFQSLTESNIQHIAIGEPATVPAGKYARQALQHARLWDTIQPKLVTTKDVRQVLTYVETGNTEAGIVYQSDVINNHKVRVISKVDPTWYSPIVYPMAIIRDSGHTKEAQLFENYLNSKEGHELLKKYGFNPIEP